jgi:hypothetical protein
LVNTGIDVRLYKAATTHTDMTTEAMTDSGDHLRYAITDKTMIAWDNTHAFTVYSDGAPVDAANYTIEYPVGEVVFTASMAGHTITVTGAYFAIDKTYKTDDSELARDWEEEDITSHGDGAVCNYPTIDFYTLSVGGQHDADSTWQNRSGGKYIVIFSETGTYSADKIDSGSRWAFYATVSPRMSASVKGIVRDQLEFRSTGTVYHRSD